MTNLALKYHLANFTVKLTFLRRMHGLNKYLMSYFCFILFNKNYT